MAKTVKFLKDHDRHKKGEIASIMDNAADYFIKCNVAIELKVEDAPKQTKTVKPKQTKTVKPKQTK